ncbi:hypothetical protein GCM10022223_45100 [Kineosporia mesophila]|uniref:Uncharacterized protein n=1 Tax=Kineosporia mesophila TaxID=566012 RepID=A0ABP7A1F6_9ACTN|nr:hypothetical protein [Kineosporia mesophila]MCD5348931.1 hypothetical protein [Kineosporia mesophila]
MAEDAFASGGIVKINTDLLKNFATMNLKGFLDELNSNVHVQQMADFSEGAGSGPTLSPSRHFTTVLPGNGTQLASAGTLRSHFTNVAGYVNKVVLSLQDNAEKMQTDLLTVSDIIDSVDQEAGLTAEQMRTDLSDVNGSTTTAPPATT